MSLTSPYMSLMPPFGACLLVTVDTSEAALELPGLGWTMQAVQAIASTISDVIGAPDGLTPEPATPDAKLQGATADVPALAAAAPALAAVAIKPAVHVTSEEMDSLACMAADWLSLLARGPEGTGACQAATAGLATAVILCCSTRCCPFIAPTP